MIGGLHPSELLASCLLAKARSELLASCLRAKARSERAESF